MRRIVRAREQNMTPNVGTPLFQCRHLKVCVADLVERGELEIDHARYQSQFEVSPPKTNPMEHHEPYGASVLDPNDPELQESDIFGLDDDETEPVQTPARTPVQTPVSQKPDCPVFDEFPGMVISPDELNKRQLQLIKVRDKFMKRDVDYGKIPGTSGADTLLKPGAEKLCALFGWAVEINVSNRIEDFVNGFVSYEVMVKLSNKDDGRLVAKGIGLCNSGERKYKNQEAANVANTCIKMAKKRALVDATLAGVGASGLFASEEDLLDDGGDHNPALPPPRPRPQAQSNQAPAPVQSSRPVPQAAPQAAPVRAVAPSPAPVTPAVKAAPKPGGRPGTYDPATHGQTPECPQCGGAMWDNRPKIASGQFAANRPYFGCKDRECGTPLWGPRDGGAQGAQDSLNATTDEPVAPGTVSPKSRSALDLYNEAANLAGFPGGEAEMRAMERFLGLPANTIDVNSLADSHWNTLAQGIQSGELTW